MLAAEAEERREQRGVAEVAYSLACAAAAAAAWEEGGRVGERPAYRSLPLPVVASPLGQFRAGGGALYQPHGMPGVLLLAGSVAAALFGGSSTSCAGTQARSLGRATAEVQSWIGALLQQLRLPNEAALRRSALLAAMPAVAAAIKAATAAATAAAAPNQGSPSSGLPLSASALRQVQASATQQGVITFLATSLLQCERALQGPVGQQGEPGPAPEAANAVQAAAVYALAPLPPFPAWDAPLAAAYQMQSSSSTAASKGSRGGAAMVGCPKAGACSARGGRAPAGVAAGGAQAALGRCLTIGRAPAAVCFHCCAGVEQEGEAVGPC